MKQLIQRTFGDLTPENSIAVPAEMLEYIIEKAKSAPKKDIADELHDIISMASLLSDRHGLLAYKNAIKTMQGALQLAQLLELQRLSKTDEEQRASMLEYPPARKLDQKIPGEIYLSLGDDNDAFSSVM
jgi:hypothetical protein